MIVEPLSEAQKRVNAIQAALIAYRDELESQRGKCEASDWMGDYASAYGIAIGLLTPVFAAVDGREVMDAEPADTQPPCFCCLHSGTLNTPENRARLRQTFCQGMAPCVETKEQETTNGN